MGVVVNRLSGLIVCSSANRPISLDVRHRPAVSYTVEIALRETARQWDVVIERWRAASCYQRVIDQRCCCEAHHVTCQRPTNSQQNVLNVVARVPPSFVIVGRIFVDGPQRRRAISTDERRTGHGGTAPGIVQAPAPAPAAAAAASGVATAVRPPS